MRKLLFLVLAAVLLAGCSSKTDNADNAEYIAQKHINSNIDTFIKTIIELISKNYANAATLTLAPIIKQQLEWSYDITGIGNEIWDVNATASVKFQIPKMDTRIEVQGTVPLRVNTATSDAIGNGIDFGSLRFKKVDLKLEKFEAKKKDCENGNYESCNSVGYEYDSGNVVEQNYIQAVAYFDKACRGGSRIGCSNLGIMYQEGRGVGQSYTEAAEYYKKACDAKNENACNSLGKMYRDGQGVEYDMTRAKELFNAACILGSKRGCENYKLL